ncbi:hypothetical protein PsYK624_086040 [Phanerochaete sordida]|uniref:Uncharacterized protein n=1 Tax=Phanerochaete sordida TaxID=48140 RepID=A0A9P3GCZ9_9APHY|nr:hypothetical protein PsYK624_086040 [Phanerochaete sordida]
MPAQLFKTIKTVLVAAVLAASVVSCTMNAHDTGQSSCVEPSISLSNITSAANTSVSYCQPDPIFGPFPLPSSSALSLPNIVDSDPIATISHITSDKVFVSTIAITSLPSATVSVLNISTTFATPAIAFASPSPISVITDTRATQDNVEIDWDILAPLAQRACLLALFFFLAVHLRRLVKDMRSSTASAAALKLLNAGMQVTIARFEGQVKTAANTLARFPPLLASLHHAVERSVELDLTTEARIDHDFEGNAGHLRNTIALYDEKYSLENDVDSLRCSLDIQRYSETTAAVAAEEQIASSLAQLSEHEARLLDLDIEIEGHAAAAETLKAEIDTARVDSHTPLAEKDVARKHLAYLHEMDCREAAESDAEIAELKAQLAHLMETCELTTGSIVSATHVCDKLTEDIEHVFLASHHAQQALIGDIACATTDISSLNADLVQQDSEHEQLVAAHDALTGASAQLDKDANALESAFTQLQIDEASMRAASLKDAEDHAVKMATLINERDALDVSQMSALDKLAEVKGQADRVVHETAALLSALREKQATNKQHFDEAAAALETSIAQDTTAIADRQATILTLEASTKSTQAALEVRRKEFERRSENYENDMNASWELKATADYDKQMYDSLLVDEDRLADRARKEQAECEALADKARAHSREVAQETAVTKHAFTTQLRDLQAEASSLEAAIAELKAASARLPAENAQLEREVADREHEYTVRKRALDIREREARDEMTSFKMSEEAALARIDARIVSCEAEQAAATKRMTDYQGEVERLQGVADAVRQELDDTEDELAVERSNAAALFDLIQHPSSDPVFVAAYAKPRTPVVSLQEPEPEGDDYSAIFDASFEEALEGDIAESKTCKGLAEAGLGLGLML